MNHTPTVIEALVADDDPIYRDVAASALIEAGFSVDTAADGASALDLLTQKAYGVAIIDLTMPDLDGFEVIRQTRSSGMSQNVPIIVMTGNDDVGSIRTAYDIGATSFLAKPINWTLFAHHVEFVTKAGRVEAELRHARRTAEVLTQIKGDLISVAANEFRGPLQTAYGFVELLRKEAMGPLGAPIYKAYADDVAVCIEQLNVAVLRMLQSGNALAASLVLSEELVAVDQLLAEAVGAVESKAQRRGVLLNTKIDVRPPPKLLGDRSLLIQALRSLVENAVQVSPRNSCVTIVAAANPNGEIVFNVHDSGPTITREHLQNPLTPSMRAPTPMNSSKERSVGVSIGKILIDAHQGRLEISSNAGEGTTSRLILPKSRIAQLAA